MTGALLVETTDIYGVCINTIRVCVYIFVCCIKFLCPKVFTNNNIKFTVLKFY